jgi:nicotinamide-nucleotide amidase
VIRSRVLRTWGQTESGLAEMLAGRIEELDAPGNPTLAFQASGIEGIKVRITAKAGSAEEAETILSGEEARLRAILGDAIFGIDNETMESVVIDMLRDRGLSLGIAESLTGGLMGARITCVGRRRRACDYWSGRTCRAGRSTGRNGISRTCHERYE